MKHSTSCSLYCQSIIRDQKLRLRLYRSLLRDLLQSGYIPNSKIQNLLELLPAARPSIGSTILPLQEMGVVIQVLDRKKLVYQLLDRNEAERLLTQIEEQIGNRITVLT